MSALLHPHRGKTNLDVNSQLQVLITTLEYITASTIGFSINNLEIYNSEATAVQFAGLQTTSIQKSQRNVSLLLLTSLESHLN